MHGIISCLHSIIFFTVIDKYLSIKRIDGTYFDFTLINDLHQHLYDVDKDVYIYFNGNRQSSNS